MQDLIVAIYNNDYLKVKKLLKEKSIDINQPIENEQVDNIFFFAVRNKVDTDILRLLVDAGLDLSYTNKEGVGIFDEAVCINDLEFVKYLVEEKGMDPLVTKRKSGFKPIMQAASYGYLDIVKYLIQKGADIEEVDNFGFNAKDYARKLRQTVIQEYFKTLEK